METLIVEEPIENLVRHARVPIAFVVDRVLSVTAPERGLEGIRLTETTVATPWVKDYDAIEGEGPTRWASRFDVSRWGSSPRTTARGGSVAPSSRSTPPTS